MAKSEAVEKLNQIYKHAVCALEHSILCASVYVFFRSTDHRLCALSIHFREYTENNLQSVTEPEKKRKAERVFRRNTISAQSVKSKYKEN